MWKNVALCRVNDDIADTGTTVLAIETHHGKWQWDIAPPCLPPICIQLMHPVQ